MPGDTSELSTSEVRLQEIIAEYLAAEDRGQPIDRTTFLARYPEFGTELTAFLDAHERLRRVAEKHPAPVLRLFPRSFGDYELLEEIGRGGMGVVYKARQLRLGRTVALKVLEAALTDSPIQVERFRREAIAAAQLAHSNIVQVYDAEQYGQTHILVMEYVDGRTLAQLVKEQGPLPVVRACDYVRQAVLGLQHAFEWGMVHRDIKPQNLMVTAQVDQGQASSQDVIKILDFGLARLANWLEPSGEVTASGTVLGTADYMAPEQAEDPHGADTRADIYSLGCTFYFLLTGQPPFPEGTLMQKLKAHEKKDPRPVASFRGDVPSEVASILAQMMAKNPADRCQTPAEVAEALTPWVQPLIDVPSEHERTKLSRTALGSGSGSSEVSNDPVLVDVAFSSSAQLDECGAANDVDWVKVLRRLRQRALARRKGAADGVGWEKILPWARLGRYGFIVLAFLGVLAWWALSRSGSSTSVKGDEDEETLSPRANTFVPRGPGRPGGQQQSLFNLSALGEVGPLKGHTGPVERVAFSPDGHHAVTGSLDKTVRVWSADTGEMLAISNGHAQPVHDVAFSPDGKVVLSASSDMTARMWEAGTGKPVRTFAGHTSPVHAVAISADQRRQPAHRRRQGQPSQGHGDVFVEEHEEAEHDQQRETADPEKDEQRRGSAIVKWRGGQLPQERDRGGDKRERREQSEDGKARQPASSRDQSGHG